MNIFYLDKDLSKSAEYLCDKHIVKMIIEHIQLLSTALRLTSPDIIQKFEVYNPYNGTYKIISLNLFSDENPVFYYNGNKISFVINNSTIYKATHINHPSNVWTRKSLSNFKWLIDYTESMLLEYTFRYCKLHKCKEILECIKSIKPNIPELGFTEFALAMPEEYKTSDPIESYRNYYMHAKRNIVSWRNRDVPYWFV